MLLEGVAISGGDEGVGEARSEVVDDGELGEPRVVEVFGAEVRPDDGAKEEPGDAVGLELGRVVDSAKEDDGAKLIGLE